MKIDKKGNKTRNIEKVKNGTNSNNNSTNGNENADLEGPNLHSVKSINKIVFDQITNLTNNTETIRIQASLQLIQHLSKIGHQPDKVKEIEYVLKRLIRGVGASTTQSRAGFFTTLVACFELFSNTQAEIYSVENLLQITQDQLKVKGAIANKEDADAIVGQILVCGALIKSRKTLNDVELVKIVKILVSGTKHRQYHYGIAFSFIIEILNEINASQFEKHVLPLLREEIIRPWTKQTVHTVHCLILAQEQFPEVMNAKFLKDNFGSNELIQPKNFESIYKLFWGNTNIGIVAMPGFEIFSNYIYKCKYFKEFWKFIDSHLLNVTKIREIITIKIVTDVLRKCNFSLKEIFEVFLTKNFTKMITTTLKTFKIKNDDAVKAFYDEFFEALTKYCKESEDDSTKILIIRQLILHPGQIDIEKFTSINIIKQISQNLNASAVKELFQVYKEIFLNKLPKNPNDKNIQWLNFERQNAGYMLQNLINLKSVQAEFDWRTEEIQFFMLTGLFHVNEDLEVSKDDGIITNEFAEQMKNIFYSTLQTKMIKIKNEKKILMNLVETCNAVLSKKNFNKCLRNKITDKIFKSWNEMYAECKKSTHDELQKIFHLLLLHMGLQLFREPEMAEAAILDLEKCMGKVKEKVSQKNDSEGDELNWIEVVVDLFLHLLSQNNCALRTIVNCVFPHLTKYLTLTAVHQILSVLEMKDGYNPLSNAEEESTENGVHEKSEDENSGDDESNLNDSGDEEEGSDDSDDENIMEEEEEEDITETDKLRNVISQALGKLDADQESVDLDDMDEEEGQKLDDALSEAFKAMRKSSNSNNKRTKDYRIKTTTVMHFRIRVLDLIDIYLQNNPSLLITLEILSHAFNMIEHCIEKEHQPLAIKVEKTLNKLTQLRQFSPEKDVSEEDICNYLRLIVEKKIKANTFEAHNKIRSKCCQFLIYAGKLCCPELQKMSKMFSEYITDFISSRNPICNITLLSDLFKTRSLNFVLNLADELCKNGLLLETRTYRRIQILELLEILYKNHALLQDSKDNEKLLKNINKIIMNHIQSLTKMNTVSLREFIKVLDLLVAIQRFYKKINTKHTLDSDVLRNHVQEIRKRIKLENRQSYERFCQIFNIKSIKNSEITESIAPVAKDNEKNDTSDDETMDTSSNVNNHQNKQKMKASEVSTENISCKGNKRKSKEIDFRKEKKLKKELRLKKSSEGLNGGFSFTKAMNNNHLGNGTTISDDDE